MVVMTNLERRWLSATTLSAVWEGGQPTGVVRAPTFDGVVIALGTNDVSLE